MRKSIKERAKKLRAEGKTYSEIKKLLNSDIPKSTLSYWCKDIPLSLSYQEKIDEKIKKGGMKGRAIALLVNKQKREEYLTKIKRKAEKLTPLLKDVRIAKIALAMLYLGEGGKWKSHRGLLLGSSDPDIVKIYIMLLERCYGIDKRQLKARISYRSDQDIKKLTRFWVEALEISPHQFYKTKPDPRTTGDRTRNEKYKGVCTIYCAGTHIQLELDNIARSMIE